MKKIALLLIMGFCFLSAGCAFQLRSKSMISSELYQLYFLPEKPYSELSTQLNTLFRSLGIVLVKKESQAHFSLIITNDLFSYSRPDVIDASLPATLNFLQSAHVEIRDIRTHKMVAAQEFTVNHSLTLNANQIYTADANDLIREKLNREIVSLIYYWLISSQTKDSIHHAIIPSTTRRAA